LRPGPFRKEDTIPIDRAVATAAKPTTGLRGDKESKGGLPHDQLFVITRTGERAIVEVDRLATDDAARLIVRANNELEDTRRGEILKWDRVARKLLSINRTGTRCQRSRRLSIWRRARRLQHAAGICEQQRGTSPGDHLFDSSG
jgi:hypothetical protein